VVSKALRRGAHRRRRERTALPGMMLHQDGSTHEWVPGKMWDLIDTMDDANSEHYSMFFTDQEGTASSFQGVKEVILAHGLFCSIYTDRGSHYWFTPKAGGKVDKTTPTQFGRAMQQLGIEMIPPNYQGNTRTQHTPWSRSDSGKWRERNLRLALQISVRVDKSAPPVEVRSLTSVG